MTAPDCYTYEANDHEVAQGLAFLGPAALSAVSVQTELFQLSLRNSVLQAAEDLAMRRAALGPIQPIDRVGLAMLNSSGHEYWRSIYNSSIVEEVAFNNQYCQLLSHRRIVAVNYSGGQYDSNGVLIPFSQNQQTIYETPDTAHARITQAYVKTCAEKWVAEQAAATSSGVIKGWVTGAYHREVRLKGICSIKDDLKGLGFDFGNNSWVGTALIPSGLPGWAAQCKDAELVSSLFGLCPITLEQIHQLVCDTFSGFYEYSFFNEQYCSWTLGIDHSETDTNTPIYASRNLVERSSLRIAIVAPGGNICVRHSMDGQSFCKWVEIYNGPLAHSVDRSVFSEWIRFLSFQDSWKSTLGSSGNTVDVYEVQRVLRQEDVSAYDELLKGKQKAMRKKILTLGISGGDLKRNSQARSDLLVSREQRRLQLDSMAVIGDTVHSAKDLEARDGRWLGEMVHAPLWLAESTQSRAKMSAMNMGWRGSSNGKVEGDVYCHAVMSYPGDIPDYVQWLLVGHVDAPPDKAAGEIDTMIQNHAAGLGALMQTAVTCRAIYNAPPAKRTDGSLFG